MNGTLVQLISLCTYGNAYLQGLPVEEKYFEENDVFKFCNSVQFRTYKETFLSRKEVIVADDPINWFHYLKQQKCAYLTLDFEYSKDQSTYKDYKMAGFVGGGRRWAIKLFFPKDMEFLLPMWKLAKEKAEDSRIWSVFYFSVDIMKVACGYTESLKQIREQLYKVLDEISQFAMQNNLAHWSKLFTDALFSLSSEKPNEDYYYNDLLPAGLYSLEAEQVFYAAAKSFVFGGMGSWNDLGFQDAAVQEKYEHLSSLLYDTVVKAIQISVNFLRDKNWNLQKI